MNKRTMWIRFLLLAAVLAGGFQARRALDRLYERQAAESPGAVTEYSDGKRVGRELEYAPSVEDGNPLLETFKSSHTDAEVLLACEEDLTDDGLSDLVILYSLESEKVTGFGYTPVWLTVEIGEEGGSASFTEPIRAPVENQKIHFKNIDEKDEMEFVLQGSKGEKIGYGIFRVMDGKTVNLFGEGMEEC